MRWKHRGWFIALIVFVASILSVTTVSYPEYKTGFEDRRQMMREIARNQAQLDFEGFGKTGAFTRVIQAVNHFWIDVGTLPLNNE